MHSRLALLVRADGRQATGVIKLYYFRHFKAAGPTGTRRAHRTAFARPCLQPEPRCSIG